MNWLVRCHRMFVGVLFVSLLVLKTRAFAGPPPPPRGSSSSNRKIMPFRIREPTSTIARKRIVDGRIIKTRGGALPCAESSATKLSLSPIMTTTMIPILDFSNPLWRANGLYVAANAAGFLISAATGSHLHLDLIGSGAFALATIPTLIQGNASAHSAWSSRAVALWGAKLAGILFFRATQIGHDKRLEELLLTSAGAFQFWFVTFVWNVLCSMPHLLGLCNIGVSGIGDAVGDGILKAGGTIYVLGLAIETIADVQKYLFKRANPGKFCNAGLWRISQHPNYLGNLVLWFGILIMNSPWLIESATAPPLLAVAPPAVDGNSVHGGLLLTEALKSSINWLWRCRRLVGALVSPWFLWTLFNSQASGTMTNGVELANSKYGNDPIYKEYIENVPLIFPKF